MRFSEISDSLGFASHANSSYDELINAIDKMNRRKFPHPGTIPPTGITVHDPFGHFVSFTLTITVKLAIQLHFTVIK